MKRAQVLPSAADELRALDAGSQRRVLGAIRALRVGALAVHALGAGGSYIYSVCVDPYVLVYVEVEDVDVITITEIALPGARDQFARLDEALDRLDGLDASDPRSPVLAKAITSLAADQPIVKQIRRSADSAGAPDLHSLRQLRPRD